MYVHIFSKESTYTYTVYQIIERVKNILLMCVIIFIITGLHGEGTSVVLYILFTLYP